MDSRGGGWGSSGWHMTLSGGRGWCTILSGEAQVHKHNRHHATDLT